jgi:hypothetical protein
MLSYMVEHTPSAAVMVAIQCARDGATHFRELFSAGLGWKLRTDETLEAEFLNVLCKEEGLAYAAPVVECYLDGLDEYDLKRLLTGNPLKKKGHPANACFYGASFTTGSGPHFLDVLDVLIEHGLDLNILSVRNCAELERAASLCHREFLRLVVPKIQSLPEEVVRCVLVKSMKPAESISILVDECGVPLERFLSPKLIAEAQPAARDYVHARAGRQERIPESVPDSQGIFEL